MKTNIEQQGLQKIETDFQWLLGRYRQVLLELGENRLVQHLFNSKGGLHPRIPNDQETIDKMTQALSIAFQLLNLVEENAAVQFRRKLEDQIGLSAIRGSWAETFDLWKQANITELQAIKHLKEIRIMPVLTAHPTEAKRVSIIELHREFYLLLVKKENSTWSNKEKQNLFQEIDAILDRWCRTGEIYLEKPNVQAERDNIMYYFKEVFPRALRETDQNLRSAWNAAGYDPDLLEKADHYPIVEFGSWIGGDRDGHPYVSAEVTKETLSIHRAAALELLQNGLKELGAKISFSNLIQPTPNILSTAIQENIQTLGGVGQEAVERNPNEPWRQFVNLIQIKLQHTKEGSTEAERAYPSTRELQADLSILRASIQAVNGQQIALNLLLPLERMVQCFGFHLARLDIRQNSTYHEKAMDQLLEATGFAANQFSNWSEAERVAFLSEELHHLRPFAVRGQSYGPEADAVLAYFSVIADHIREYGPAGIGSFIVSMTRDVSDLLVVSVFMREVGLTKVPLQIVPLFETIEDLQRAPQVLDAFLKHPVSQQRRTFLPPIQEIMLGYSDSNKDGGILSSRWSIYQAESQLSAIAAQNGLKCNFFHGRGGTISRGGGKYHRFWDSMPLGSVSGQTKFTVQGETIAQQFANPLNAAYNLEMNLAGIARQLFLDQAGHPYLKQAKPIIARLAEKSKIQYKQLTHHPGFIPFFRQATPIDVLEHSKIGSRPSRRTGQNTLDDLRAIPWVFSWNQSRFHLSGWFGIGKALTELATESPEDFSFLQSLISKWPFWQYFLIQVETNLLQVDTKLMHDYAKLVEEATSREDILALILEDYEQSITQIQALFGTSSAERRISQMENNARRHPALTILNQLHLSQIKDWRASKDDPNTDQASILQRLLLMTNAISGGLKSTG